MRQPSNPDQRRLLKKAIKAGCTVKDTNSGWRVLLPNGGSVAMHTSSSDRRALANTRSNFRREGLDLDAV
jgi:hypothetical protein